MSPMLPDVLTIEVFPDFPLSSLKNMIADEVPTIPADKQFLYLAGHLLSDNDKTLTDHGIGEQDMLMLHTRETLQQLTRSQQQAQGGQAQQGRGSGQQQQQQPGQFTTDTEVIRLRLLGDPNMMRDLREQQPELANAINDPQQFSQIFQLMEQKRRDAEREKDLEISRLNDDPFNVDSQRRIEELIREDRVRENLQTAMEYHPESFGRVTMLYVPTEVNGHPVKAFVDSGAQMTIMSPSCAEKCGIMRLIDHRFAGIAKGVGTAKLLGRVHSAQIKIGTLFLPCSFTVMEGKDVDLLLGLDMLKRHQACVNLKTNSLEIGDVSIPFLPENECPGSFGADEDEPMIEGPSGSKISQESGVVVQPPSGPENADFQGAPPGITLPGSSEPQASGSTPGPILSQTTIPPPGATSTHPPPLPAGRQTEYPAELVASLTGLGFSEQEAVAALRATNGNVELAASLLFQ